MELEQMQELWRQLDTKVERTLTAQSNLLREIRLHKTRRRLNRIALLPGFDIVFGVIVVLITGSFLAEHWMEMTLSIPALCLHLAGIVLLIDSARQLALAARVAWDGPIAEIQFTLARLRHARIRQFKWIILLGPLTWFCLMVVGGKLLFDGNLIESANRPWVIANIVFGLLFIPVASWITRSLSQRWHNNFFWRTLVDSISGQSLATAQQELERWSEAKQSF